VATKYWVGGNGNWSSLTNWRTTSGGAVVTTAPGSADAAVLDVNSSTDVVTVDSNITIQTLTCTGFTGTLAFGTNTISLNSTGTIFTGATTMTVTGTPLIICTNSSATARTITPGLVSEANAISFRITAGTGSLALTSANSNVKDLDFTDGVNPTGFAGSLTNTFVNIYGSLKASTGMTVTAGNGALAFLATSGTKTIDTAGVTFDRPFTFNGAGGTFQLASALTSGATRTTTLTAGTFDLAGYTLTTGIFGGAGSGVRKFANNTASIIVTGNAATVVSFGTTTNLTADFTPVFELNYSGSVGTRSVSWGSSNLLYVPSILVTAGSDIVTTSGTTTVSSLFFSSSFTGTLGNATRNIYGNLTLSSGMATPSSGSLVTTFNGIGSQSIITANKTLDFPIRFNGIGGTWAMQDALTLGSTQSLTMTNGTLQLKSGTTSTVGSFATSGTNQKFLSATTPGSQATLSQASGTDSVSYLTIQDSNATGGATFDATDATNVNAGNNTGWIFFPTPADSNEITMRLRSFTQPRRF